MEHDILLKTIFAVNGYQINGKEEDWQLELDSLQFISIICDIENKFDIEIPENFLTGEGLDSYTDILNMVVKIKSEKR
jgi:acyl carrier protein